RSGEGASEPAPGPTDWPETARRTPPARSARGRIAGRIGSANGGPFRGRGRPGNGGKLLGRPRRSTPSPAVRAPKHAGSGPRFVKQALCDRAQANRLTIAIARVNHSIEQEAIGVSEQRLGIEAQQQRAL